MENRAWRVYGRVQGVFFRASARQEALRLGLDGYARNLPDGSVEVAAHGEARALDALAEWLRDGPQHARVSALEPVTPPSHIGAGFDTL